jgi:hypothetical protein
VIHSALLNAINVRVLATGNSSRAICIALVLELRAYFNRTCDSRRKEHADRRTREKVME